MDYHVVLCAGAIVLLLLWWRSSRRYPDLPPSPSLALPLVGHLYLLHGKDPRAQLRAWRRKHGDIFSLYMGNTLLIVLNGYDVIREALLKQADAFSDRPKPSMFDLVTKAKGVGDTSGPLWKSQRKTMMEILRQFGMGKNMLAEKVEEEVGQLVKAIGAKDGLPFDPCRLVHISISNNICSFTFGKRFQYDDLHFMKLVDAMGEMFKYSGTASVTAFLPFLRYLPGDLFRIQKAIDCYHYIANTFLIPAIDQQLSDLDDHNQQDNFIRAYLREAREASQTESGEYINEFNLQKVLMDVFAAGTDTSATIIRWALIYLLHHPLVQHKCHQDIVKVIGTNRPPKIEDRAKMTYMEATIMEVLRISEIAPLGVMHSTAFQVQLRGYTLPKDVCVMPNMDSVLHDPDVWQEPDTFRPERFLDAEGNLVRRDQFIPFSIGRRICPGESLARMELFLYLTSMIQRFQFLPPEDGQLPSLQGTVGLIHDPKPFQVRAVLRT